MLLPQLNGRPLRSLQKVNRVFTKVLAVTVSVLWTAHKWMHATVRRSTDKHMQGMDLSVTWLIGAGLALHDRCGRLSHGM